jgi:hypothetical protein
MPLPVPPRPWFSISMDYITDLPESETCDAILVIVDRFSKLAHFVPCRKAMTTLELAILFIQEVVRLHGVPNDIITDRGPHFISQFWSALLSELRINRNLSSAYHPQTDGQTERTNQTLEQYLRIYVDYQQSNWVSCLPLAELTYNTTSHDAIRMTPMEATYGFTPILIPELELIPDTVPSVTEWLSRISDNHILSRLQLNWTREQMKKIADTKRRDIKFKVGDMVFLNRQNLTTQRPCRKLDWKRFGPFRIIEIINPVSYRLELPQSLRRIHNVFHISLLSPRHSDASEYRQNQEPPPLLVDAQGPLYEVEAILNRRIRNNVPQYLVAWRNYGAEHNTWEPLLNLADCMQLVEDYDATHPRRRGRPPGGGEC